MRVKHLAVWIMLTAMLLLLLQSQVLFVGAQLETTTHADNSLELSTMQAAELTTHSAQEAQEMTAATAASATAAEEGYQNDEAPVQPDTTAMPSQRLPEITVAPASVLLKCYSCNSAVDASCALRPVKLLDCPAASKGCFTRFKLDTKQIERGCLAEEPKSYCEKHQKQCDICPESACNAQVPPTAAAVASTVQYGMLTLSVLMACSNWLHWGV